MYTYLILPTYSRRYLSKMNFEYLVFFEFKIMFEYVVGIAWYLRIVTYLLETCFYSIFSPKNILQRFDFALQPRCYFIFSMYERSSIFFQLSIPFTYVRRTSTYSTTFINILYLFGHSRHSISHRKVNVITRVIYLFYIIFWVVKYLGRLGRCSNGYLGISLFFGINKLNSIEPFAYFMK